MKKTSLIVILTVLCVLLAGAVIFLAVRSDDRSDASSADASSGKPDYYRIGLDVAQTMGEMIRNDDYAAIIGADSAEITEMRNKMDTNDYDSPVAVYEIRVKSIDDFFFATDSEFDREQWNRLSDNLKEQINNRFSVQTVFSYLNAKVGMYETAVSSLYITRLKDERLTEPDGMGAAETIIL